MEKAPLSERPETGFEPRSYSLASQIAYAAKCGGVIALTVLVLWLMDHYS